MLGNIKYRGVDSSTFGILLNYEEISIKPARRSEVLSVIGKDGAQVFTDSHDMYEITLQCRLRCNVVERRSRARQISAWLQGFGDLVIGVEQDVRYTAYPISGVQTALFPVLEDFEITFLVQPIKKSTLEDDLVWSTADVAWAQADIAWQGVSTAFTNVTSGQALAVENIGNYMAKPRIILSGTATTVNLAVNGETFTFNNLSGTITIDNENFLVYSGTTTKVNEIRNSNANFLTLNTGNNNVVVTGTGFSNLNVTFEEVSAYI